MQNHIYICRSWSSHILSLQQDSQMIIYMVRICDMQQKSMLGTLKLYVCTINFVGPRGVESWVRLCSLAPSESNEKKKRKEKRRKEEKKEA